MFRASRRLWIFAALLPMLSCRGGPKPEAMRSDEGQGAPSVASCEPPVMVLEADVSLQIANEWTKATLLGAGFRADLSAWTPEQRKAVADWLKTQSGQQGRDMRICQITTAPGAPSSAAVIKARQHLRGFSDWCWEVRPLDL
jgi:hypothetical protein